MACNWRCLSVAIDSAYVAITYTRNNRCPCYCSIADLDVNAAGTTVLVRGRVHVSRDTGKVAFVTLRQGIATVQAVAFKATNADLHKWIGTVSKESVVDVTATVTLVEKPVESTTQRLIELQISTMFVVSKASPVLPFQLEDAARPDAVVAAREEEAKKAEAGASIAVVH